MEHEVVERAVQEIISAGIPADRSASVLGELGQDFGRLVRSSVAARVRPGTLDELRSVVSIAISHRVNLAARGFGLSQSGQSLPVDGLSIDTSAFQGVEVDTERELVRCGAGATWRDVLAATSVHGLLPLVVPLNLDITVGGTLSAGGMGSTSHRHGMACSSVETFEFVSGAAEHLRASAHENRDAYDCVLGGIGQFGILTEATLRLRRTKPYTRTAYLLYDDLETMAADQLKMASDPRCIHLEGFASAAVQGVRQQGDRRVPFARWFYGLHVSTEASNRESGELEDLLSGLSPRERVYEEENDSVAFMSRYDIRFQVMRATNAWEQIHPWFECTLPRSSAVELIGKAIAELPLALGDGHRIMPVAEVPRPRFLKIAKDGPAQGLTILPMGIAPPFEQMVLATLERLHHEFIAAGGKRYLSGWLFEPDEAAWKRHFGEDYDDYLACKRRFDPAGIFRSKLRA